MRKLKDLCAQNAVEECHSRRMAAMRLSVIIVQATKRFQTEKYSFKEGDLVVWKKGLKHKQVPDYGVPAVVIKILDTPISDNEAPLASPYYREELDVLLGILDDDDDLLCFYYDSKRFEPFAKQ